MSEYEDQEQAREQSPPQQAIQWFPLMDPRCPPNIRGGTIIRLGTGECCFVPDMALEMSHRANLQRIATALESIAKNLETFVQVKTGKS